MFNKKNPYVYVSLIMLAVIVVVFNTVEFTEQQYTHITRQLIFNAVLQVIIIFGVTLYNRNKDDWGRYFSISNLRVNSTLIPLTILIYFITALLTPIALITQIVASTIQIFLALDTIRTIDQIDAVEEIYQEKYKALERTSTK